MDGSKPRPIFPRDVHGAIGAHAAPVVVNLHCRFVLPQVQSRTLPIK
jgi:hypothetical protein